MMRSLRSEAGFTVTELAVAMLLGAVALALMGGLLVSASNTSIFTTGQSSTLDDARIAMQQIEKEIRAADYIDWCVPAGSCLEVGASTPTGGFRTVKYVHAAESLTRAVFDPDTSSWGNADAVVDRVVNENGRPVFGCDTRSSLLRVTVDLVIEPTPQSNPSLNMHTTLRPRNFPSKAACP